MKKIMGVVLLVLLVFGMLGCVQPSLNTTPINNQSDAAKAVSDVGTDLGGISNSLDDIDSALVESPTTTK